MIQFLAVPLPGQKGWFQLHYFSMDDCRVVDPYQAVKHFGTLESCVAWLEENGLKLTDMSVARVRDMIRVQKELLETVTDGC